MIKSGFRRSGKMLALAGIFLYLLAGFQSSDIVYDQCRKTGPGRADCAQFKAEGAGQAQNVILLIGDGMGLNQIYAARVYLNGPETPLALESLPFRGLVTTCCIGSVTDSAAAATALATGHKTKKGVVGKGPGPKPEVFGNFSEQVREHKAVGIVSTAAIWDATPAAFVSHVDLRAQDLNIAEQMVMRSRPEVILGGGAKTFERGRTAEGEDLIRATGKAGYAVVRTAEELKAFNSASTRRLLGLFAAEEMEFEVLRPDNSTEPHLSEMAAAALDVLGNDPRGFFLMIEGGRIDHACHQVDLDKMLGEMAEFERTVELALAWARRHPPTLVLVTADHETGGMEVIPLNYRKGDKVKVRWTTQLIPGRYANHSSQRVAVFGEGPNAGAIRPHLDNTEVYCIMRNAFGL